MKKCGSVLTSCAHNSALVSSCHHYMPLLIRVFKKIIPVVINAPNFDFNLRSGTRASLMLFRWPSAVSPVIATRSGFNELDIVTTFSKAAFPLRTPMCMSDSCTITVLLKDTGKPLIGILTLTTSGNALFLAAIKKQMQEKAKVSPIEIRPWRSVLCIPESAARSMVLDFNDERNLNTKKTISKTMKIPITYIVNPNA